MRSLVLIAFTAFTVSSIKAQTAIPIQNHSFEAPVNLTTTNSCGQSSTHVPNWTIQQQPSGGSGTIAWTCEIPPDGKQVLYLANATASQDLGIPLKDGGYNYTLRFWVADWFYWYPGKYKASFMTGVTELCSTDGYAIGDFAEITLTCPVPYYISHYNGFSFPPGNIVVSFSASGWPVLFDNVSLTFTPTN